MDEAVDGQAHWDSRYSEQEYIFGEEPNQFLTEQLAILRPGMRALAVADGEGRNGVWLSQHGLAVTAIDISPVALAKARALADRHGVAVDFRQVDLLGWDWPRDAFDLVVAIFIQFAGPADRERLFAGMKQALRPGGHIVLQGYRTEQLGYGTGGPRAVENLYSEQQLRDAFADFEIKTLHSHDSVIEEGSRHRGMSAVIDLVARKTA